MRRKRFTEEQIVKLRREAEAGEVPIAELCRRVGISEFTFYRWRRRFRELSMSQARQLRELEKENVRLKQLLAMRELEIDAMKEALRKNF